MFIFMLMLVSFAIRYTQMSVLQQEVAVAQAEVIAALTESRGPADCSPSGLGAALA